MKELLKKIKWWEALLLFQVMLFLAHFITNSQIWPEVKDFDFNLKNFLIYNQLAQSFYHWMKFILVSIILFSGAYLMNKKLQFWEVLKYTLLAELVYFIPKAILFFSYFILGHSYSETSISNAFVGRFHLILGLSESSFLYSFAKNISIIDIVYFTALFATIYTASDLNKKDTSKVIGISYAPAFLLFVMVNVLFTYL